MSPEFPVQPPDWTGIGQWAAGLTTVAVAIYVAIRRGVGEAKEIVSSPPVEHTRIITADSVAMQRLAETMEANTAIMIENNTLQRTILSEVRDYLKELREDRQEAEIIAKIKEDLRRDDPTRQRVARPRRRSEQQP